MADGDRIKLGDADFYRLLAMARQDRIAAMEAQYAVEEAQRTRDKRIDLFTKLGVDTTRNYRFDETTCELVPV